MSRSAGSAASAPIEPVGSLPAVGHRADQDVEVLAGVAERGRSRSRGSGGRRQRAPSTGTSSSRIVASRGPRPVRPPRRDLALDLAVGEHPAALEVDDPQRARLQPPALHHPLGLHRHRAGLGREHDPAVVGLRPAAGPQTVAVELRAEDRGRR